MSSKTRWVSKQLWHAVNPVLTARIKSVLGDLPVNYASNIESDLHARGEHRLASDLLDELDQIGPGEPVQCAACGGWVSFGYRQGDKVYHNGCAPF